jgi:16S rRNA (guanine527-N7)-methyltransferase
LSPLAPLAELCAARGIPWDARAEERFASYMALLQQFNQSMNLIGPMDDDEIVEFLLADSAMAAAALPPSGSILDVGSGAGLPGIPLKILYPDVPITFVEPRKKRANFITIATQRLGLKGVTIHPLRIEDIPEARYDYVISKAFQPPKIWMTTAAGQRADGGHVLVMTRALELPELTPVAASLGLSLTSWASRFEAPVDDNRVVYAFG